tara:strand:- start:1343 stop:5425 length:4083 start_codon:yes stop_codon:yes gene_type:complete
MPPSFEMQTMTLKQENGALLKENSQLRVQLIQNDESCDEKLRRALAESCKLEREVSELKFWKEQAIQRHVLLEKLHDEMQVRLKTFSSVNSNQVVSIEQDAQARMELAAMLSISSCDDAAAKNLLIAGADDRAAALQERLVHAHHELKRMHKEVAAAKMAVMSREGEVKRLHSFLNNTVHVDYFALEIQSEAKDDLIATLQQQIEELNSCMVPSGREEYESGVMVSKVDNVASEWFTTNAQSEIGEKHDGIMQRHDTRTAESKRTYKERFHAALREIATLQYKLSTCAPLPQRAASDTSRLASIKDRTNVDEKSLELANMTVDEAGANEPANENLADSNTELQMKLAAAEKSRDVAELRTAVAIKDAKRVQKMLIEATNELQRARNFAEKCEHQREEVSLASQTAAEMIGKLEQKNRITCIELESVKQRASWAEVETVRLESLLILAAEKYGCVVDQSHGDTIEKRSGLSVGKMIEASQAANAQVKNNFWTRAGGGFEAPSNACGKDLSTIKPNLATESSMDMKFRDLDYSLVHELEHERRARISAETSLEVCEAAAAAARIAAEDTLSDARQSALDLQTVTAERDSACLAVKEIAEKLWREREILQAEMEATAAEFRDASRASHDVDKLTTLLRGLEAMRDDFTAKLSEAQAQTREANKRASSANVLLRVKGAKADEAVAEVARVKATIKMLDDEKDSIAVQLDARTEELAAANLRILRESEAVEDARQAAADAEARSLAAADRAADTTRLLCIANDKILQLSKAEKDLRAEAHNHCQELQAVGEDLAALTREQQKVNTELVQCAGERDLALSALNEMNFSKIKMDTFVKATQKELEDVVAAYQELSVENRRLTAAVSTLERDSHSAKLALVASEAALNKALTRIKSLEEENRQYVTDIQAFERQVESLSRSLADLERVGAGANHDSANLHEQLVASHALAMEHSRAYEQSQRELVAVESGLQIMRKRLTDSQGECEMINQRLRFETTRVRELESLLAEIREKEYKMEASSGDAEQHATISRQKEIDTLEEQNHDLQRQVSALQIKGDKEKHRAVVDVTDHIEDLPESLVTNSEIHKFRAEFIEANKSATEQSIVISKLIEETSKLRRYLDKSVTEATSAQQQVIITQRELAAATHRESILALRAEEAEESTIELKKRLNVLIEKSDAALTKKSPDVMDFPAADQHPDNAEYYNEAVVDIVLRGVMYEDEDESDAILLANKEIEILRAKNARLGHNLKDTEEAAATTAREIELESQLSTAHEKHAAIDAGFSVMDFNAGIKPQHADRFDGRRHVPDEGLDRRLRDLTLENASLRQNLAGTEEACKKMETELQRIQKEYHDLARSLSGSIDSDDVTVGRR